MKTIKKQRGSQRAFTIIELLTVMSVIVLLISILVPALNTIRRYAKQVKQRAQFHAIEVSMDMFNAEFEEFPASEEYDINLLPGTQVKYCGALKLAEAMIGQDKLGFHQSSRFRYDGKDNNGNQIYYVDPTAPLPLPTDQPYIDNMRFRKDYLSLTNANAYRLGDIYPATPTLAAWQPTYANEDVKDKFVLCDVYGNVNNLDTTGSGKAKIGMPILYYKANTSRLGHSSLAATLNNNIYDFRDNDDLIRLGTPWNAGQHPIDSSLGQAAIDLFYGNIKDKQVTITTTPRPMNSKSYILMSAGFDGEYGTADDIYNF